MHMCTLSIAVFVVLCLHTHTGKKMNKVFLVYSSKCNKFILFSINWWYHTLSRIYIYFWSRSRENEVSFECTNTHTFQFSYSQEISDNIYNLPDSLFNFFILQNTKTSQVRENFNTQ